MKNQCEQEIGEYSGSRLWSESCERTMRCPNEGTIETRRGWMCKLHATLSGAIGGGPRISKAETRYRKLKIGQLVDFHRYNRVKL